VRVRAVARAANLVVYLLEEARRLARAILRLDGLTGAEIEAAERVLSVDKADIRRLRENRGQSRDVNSRFLQL
jgi:hypothetical protein